MVFDFIPNINKHSFSEKDGKSWKTLSGKPSSETDALDMTSAFDREAPLYGILRSME